MRLAVVALVLAGCAPRFVTPPTVPPGEARVELQPLPPNALTESIPEGIPVNDRVEALEAAEKAPFAGLLFGESRAARCDILTSRYPELRVRLEQDRAVWTAHRDLYETRLQLADKAIRDLQPGWWERNSLSLGIIGGVFLGLAAGVSASLLVP